VMLVGRIKYTISYAAQMDIMNVYLQHLQVKQVGIGGVVTREPHVGRSRVRRSFVSSRLDNLVGMGSLVEDIYYYEYENLRTQLICHNQI
jgi:hypothetical protein